MSLNEPHTIHADQEDDSSRVIATAHPADPEVVAQVLARHTDESCGAAGRSRFMWLRLENDDVWLGVYPHFDALDAVRDDASLPKDLADAFALAPGESFVDDGEPAYWHALPTKKAKDLAPGDRIYWNLSTDETADVLDVHFGLGGMSERVAQIGYTDVRTRTRKVDNDIHFDADDDVKLAPTETAPLATLAQAPELAPTEVPDLVEFDTTKPLSVCLNAVTTIVLLGGWVNTNIGIHGRLATAGRLAFIPWASVSLVSQEEPS